MLSTTRRDKIIRIAEVGPDHLPLDAQRLESELDAALVRSLDRLRAEHPNERLYGVALYDGAEYGYICVSLFTEEGPDRTTETYRVEDPASYLGGKGR